MEKRLLYYSVRDGDCLVWTASRISTGYGMVSTGTGTSRLAHRAAYEEWVGPIPEGLEVHHSCYNRACIEPSHLSTITHAENTALRQRSGPLPQH